MLIDFFFKLKSHKLPVSIKEFLTLLEALQKGVIGSSVEDFYYLSRIALVKDEANFDKFDRAFSEFWDGVEAIPGIKQRLVSEALKLFYEIRDVPGMKKKPSTSELLDWLKLLMAEDIPPEALTSRDQHKIIPPLHGALLKNEQDVHLFERLVFMSRRKPS